MKQTFFSLNVVFFANTGSWLEQKLWKDKVIDMSLKNSVSSFLIPGYVGFYRSNKYTQQNLFSLYNYKKEVYYF